MWKHNHIYEDENGSIAKVNDRTFYMEVDNKWDMQFKNSYAAEDWLQKNGYKLVGMD